LKVVARCEELLLNLRKITLATRFEIKEAADWLTPRFTISAAPKIFSYPQQRRPITPSFTSVSTVRRNTF